MNKKLGLMALLASLPLHAGTMGEVAPDYPWFASIGTGYSWMKKPDIQNPNVAIWDYANEGYDSSLGDRGFYTFSLGKQVHDYVDVSFSYLDHEIFNYQKFQTGGGSTIGFTGNARTRYFKLDNRSVMLNGFLHPAQCWYSAIGLEITPYIGAGIGYARNQVRDFYTVGNTTVAGTAIGSTSSIGEIANENSFAWEGTAAINIKPSQSHLSTNIGYRYYDGGKFKGPDLAYSNSAGWVNVTPWSGRVKANQLFLEFKYSV